MEKILEDFLAKGTDLLNKSSFAPITSPQENLDPLTPPAVFLIHWAASIGEMIQGDRILLAYRPNISATAVAIELRNIIGHELMPANFEPEIRRFLQKYYRTGWSYDYRSDFLMHFKKSLVSMRSSASLTSAIILSV